MAVTSPAAVSTAAGQVVADTWQVELAIAEAASALAECAFRAGFQALRAQDHAFLRLGIHRTCNLRRAVHPASRPAIARQSDQRFSNLRNHVVSQHDANWHNDWDRRHAHFDHNRFFVFIDGFWCGLDAGYFPWDYLPYYPNDYYPYDYYTDVDPYDYNGANYNVDQADSAEVQAVQMHLARLGYYNGSIDGVFGPSTRDAVAKYQIANQLNVTGSLSPDTLQSLGLPQATAT